MGVTVADRIRTIMDEENLSQAALCRKCKINKSNLSKILTGKTFNVSPGTIRQISNAFSINPDWLRHGIGEMYKKDKEVGEAHYEGIAEYMKQEGHVPSDSAEENELLREMIELLKKTVSDKDTEIAFLRKVIGGRMQ